MKALKKIGVCCLVLVCMLGCRKIETPNYLTATEAQTYTNLAYGTHAQQKMDVYLPANRTTNTNVIIFIHGGSFIGGDKSEFNDQAKYLVSKGYAVLNVNYRLVNATGLFDVPPQHIESVIKVKDQVADISAIVDFAISNAKTWVMSNKRIGIAGHSAGGTLALLYGYDVRNANKVQAISNIAGALDMIFTDIPNYKLFPPYVAEGAYRYTGALAEPANEAVYKEISPIYQASATKLIPTLNTFPENNDVMGLPKLDIATYTKFTLKLNELKVPNEFFYLAGANHYFSRSGDWQKVLDKTVSYFNQKLQ